MDHLAIQHIDRPMPDKWVWQAREKFKLLLARREHLNICFSRMGRGSGSHTYKVGTTQKVETLDPRFGMADGRPRSELGHRLGSRNLSDITRRWGREDGTDDNSTYKGPDARDLDHLARWLMLAQSDRPTLSLAEVTAICRWGDTDALSGLIDRFVEAARKAPSPRRAGHDWRLRPRPGDVAELRARLQQDRLIAIYGMTGLGKSVLARQVAYDDTIAEPPWRREAVIECSLVGYLREETGALHKPELHPARIRDLPKDLLRSIGRNALARGLDATVLATAILNLADDLLKRHLRQDETAWLAAVQDQARKLIAATDIAQAIERLQPGRIRPDALTEREQAAMLARVVRQAGTLGARMADHATAFADAVPLTRAARTDADSRKFKAELVPELTTATEALRAAAADHGDTSALVSTLSRWPDNTNTDLIADCLRTLVGLLPDRTLLLLDDCWSWNLLTSALAGLLDGGDRLCILATSQQRPPAPFQVHAPSDPLARDGDGHADLAFAMSIIAAYGYGVPGRGGVADEPDVEALQAFRDQRMTGADAEAIRRLIEEVGGHPLTLAATATLWRLGRRPWRAGFWQDRLAAMAEAGGERYDEGLLASDPGVQRRHQQVLRALGDVLDLIGEEDQRRFLHLAALPAEGFNFPLAMVLWYGNAASHDSCVGPTEDLLGLLVDCALLQDRSVGRIAGATDSTSIGLEGDEYRLHERHRTMIRTRLGQAGERAAHQAFVQAIGCRSDDGAFQRPEMMIGARSPELRRPDGRPFLQVTTHPVFDRLVGDHVVASLARHLVAAGDHAALEQLLLDPRWMSGKVAYLGGRGVRPLIADYRLTELAPRSAAWMVWRALELSANIIEDNPSELPAQLLGRLAPENAEGLAEFLAACRQILPPFALYHSRPSLKPPGPELRRFEGHTSEVTSLAVLPGGRQALSGSWDRTLRLWDLDTGTELRRFEGHTSEVMSLAVLPGGRQALSGSRDRTLRLWDLETWVELRRFEGHTDTITCLAVLPGGRQALSGSCDDTLRLWDLDTGTELRRFEGHTSEVTSLAVLPGGRQALSGSRDRTLRLWDLDTGTEVRRFEGHTSEVMSLAVLPGGRQALSGSRDRTLRLWDLETWVELRRFEGHTDTITCLAVLPGGRQALSGSWDRTLRLWDLDTGTELRRFEGHTYDVISLALLPGGRQALSGSRDRTLRLWDLDTETELRRFEGHTSEVMSLAVLPGGRQALSGSWDRTLRLWDLDTETELRRFEGHTDPVTCLAVLPGGRQALSASRDRTLRLWDLDTGTELRRFKGHADDVRCLAVLPGGRQALSGSDDCTLRLWDLDTGTELRRFKGHIAPVTCLAVLPSGRQALSGSLDGSLRLWDLETEAELRRFEGHTDPVTCLAVLPGGGQALSGAWDGTRRLWDLDTGTELRRFEGHTDTVRCLAALPGGRQALSGSHDRTLRLWDLDTGAELSKLHLDVPVTTLATHADTAVVGVKDIHLIKLPTVFAGAHEDSLPSP